MSEQTDSSLTTPEQVREALTLALDTADRIISAVSHIVMDTEQERAIHQQIIDVNRATIAMLRRKFDLPEDYDPRVPHYCEVCPVEIRGLYAAAYNAHHSNNVGDIRRAHLKGQQLGKALDDIAPLVNRHFEAIDG